MKLLMAGPSPFARKACVVVKETGQEEDVAFVTTVAAPGGAEDVLKAANPLGKIPALVRDDGPTVYDSRVICRFLNARAGAHLYPDGNFDTLILEATAHGMMEAAVLIVYEMRFRPEEQQSAKWMEAQWEKVADALDAIEHRWMSHLAGEIDIAHIAVGCALGYLDLRHSHRNWRDGRPNLVSWYDTFAARPSMKETEPQA